MRKILIILLLFINSLFSDDFAIMYDYQRDYKIAMEKAKEQKKDIVFILVATYCPWCDKLKEEVLSLEYTQEILQKKYIPLMLTIGVDKFPKKFNSFVVPTIHFISYKDESIIETVLGFNNNYRFYEIIEAK